MSKSDDINGFLDLRKRRTISWCLSENWYFDFSFDHLIKDVSGKIKENRAWSTNGCKSDCLIDVVGDVFGWGDSDAIFSVGFHKVALINLLKGSFFSLIEIVWSTDQDHGPTVNPSIQNTADSVGMSWAGDTETYSGLASEVTSVSSWVCGLLLVSETIVIDSGTLDSES